MRRSFNTSVIVASGGVRQPLCVAGHASLIICHRITRDLGQAYGLQRMYYNLLCDLRGSNIESVGRLCQKNLATREVFTKDCS